MVDSIKGQSRAALVNAQKEASSNSLRESFKTLSSGTSVSQVAKDVPAVVNVQRRPQSGPLGELVTSLNDAVKFSQEALKALEGVADSTGAIGHRGLVKEFSGDLDKLKSEVTDLLEGLKNQAQSADVLNENIQASDTKVSDLYKAQSKAKETNSLIQFNSEEALQAHGGALTVDSVSRLLVES